MIRPRWSVILAAGLVLVLAWALGLLGPLWWLATAVWSVSPGVMTGLALAAGTGLLATLAYPRWRRGVEWREVWVGRPTAAAPDDDAVVAYLAAVRRDAA